MLSVCYVASFRENHVPVVYVVDVQGRVSDENKRVSDENKRLALEVSQLREAATTAKDKEVQDIVEQVEEVHAIETSALRDECAQLTAEKSELSATIDDMSRDRLLREGEIKTAQMVKSV
jgi:uncharacterized protein YeeX (DUF496 family)